MKKIEVLPTFLLMVLLAVMPPQSSTTLEPEPSTPPIPLAEPTAAPDPYSNDSAQVDVSRLGDGLVRVRYTGSARTQIKAQITKAEGVHYNYNLPNDGSWVPLTFTEGDGTYTLRVLEQVKDIRYRPVFDCALTVALADPLSPFRQANQHVSFTANSRSTALARELTQGLTTDEEKTQAIFDYVITALTYDEEKLSQVESGYLPNPDQVLEEGKGICYDYAAVMAAMLRSQDVPCRLVVGYAGEAYHAWTETPQEEGWQLWDPTFLSASQDDIQILDFVSRPENYAPQFYY